MRYEKNAKARWDELNNKRRGLITRVERYAAYTVRKVCPLDGYDENNIELQHDYQSVGAQATRHLVNKMMLALFAPSRPAMRLDLSPEAQGELAEMNMTEADIQDSLSAAEKEAWSGIDREAGLRPTLYEMLTHLVVAGNVLQDTTGTSVRAMPLKSYVVKRDRNKRVIEVVVRECVNFDALDPKVQAIYMAQAGEKDPDDEIEFYRWVKLQGNKYVMTQWVEKQILPKEFNGTWAEEDLPLRPLTWDLADGNDYGTGLVEDYQGDFASLSMLSEALVQSAIIASEFRWLANPGGLTKPEDIENSENGAVLPGQAGDLQLVNAQTGNAVPHLQATAADYINRIGRGFLLASAVTRNAERVTAEEIRMQAQELETSLGGAYSRIAVDMQTPLALYLLKKIGFKLQGKALRPSIVTGLDALSRASDMDNLKLLIADLIQVGSLPPQLQNMLKMDRVIKAFCAGRGLSSSTYINENAQQTMLPEEPEQPSADNPGVTTQ